MRSVELIPSKKYLLKLERRDEILSSIKSFCLENDIKSAQIQAIGAVESVDLAFYELDKMKYLKKSFSGAYEIAGMAGNISRVNGDYVTHIHGVFSNKEFRCIGGHIDHIIVGATCEVMLFEFDNNIVRKKDEEIGLNLLDI